jgi:hypothetical protein
VARIAMQYFIYIYEISGTALFLFEMFLYAWTSEIYSSIQFNIIPDGGAVANISGSNLSG